MRIVNMSGDSWSQRLPLPGRGTFPLKADFDVGIDKGPQSRYGGDDFEVNGQIDRNCSVIRGESWLVALVSQTDLERRKQEHSNVYRGLRNWREFGPFKSRAAAQDWEDSKKGRMAVRCPWRR